MSWNGLKQGRGQVLPKPPQTEANTVVLDRKVGVVDGRKARATGRTKQFNPRVRPEFWERLREAMNREVERLGEEMTQAHFLEILLANHERANGLEVRPFGLSEAAYVGAEAIAERMGWPLGLVVEDAIAARCRDLKIAKG